MSVDGGGLELEYVPASLRKKQRLTTRTMHQIEKGILY